MTSEGYTSNGRLTISEDVDVIVGDCGDGAEDAREIVDAVKDDRLPEERILEWIRDDLDPVARQYATEQVESVRRRTRYLYDVLKLPTEIVWMWRFEEERRGDYVPVYRVRLADGRVVDLGTAGELLRFGRVREAFADAIGHVIPSKEKAAENWDSIAQTFLDVELTCRRLESQRGDWIAAKEKAEKEAKKAEEAAEKEAKKAAKKKGGKS